MFDKDIRTLDNWYVTSHGSDENGNMTFILHGDVTGDPRFPDGLHIHTSRVESMKCLDNSLICVTQSGTMYSLVKAGFISRICNPEDARSMFKNFNIPVELIDTICENTASRIESYAKEASNLLRPGEIYIALYQSTILYAAYCSTEGTITPCHLEEPYYYGSSSMPTTELSIKYSDTNYLVTYLHMNRNSDEYKLAFRLGGNPDVDFITAIRLRLQTGKDCKVIASGTTDITLQSSSFTQLDSADVIAVNTDYLEV